MAQDNVYNGIYDLLVNDQTSGSFYDDLTGRIYQDFAPQNATLPFCTFAITSDPQLSTLGSNHLTATVECQVWGTLAGGPNAVRDTNDKLTALLHKGSITVTGFSNVTMHAEDIGTAERIEDAVFISSLYEITGSA